MKFKPKIPKAKLPPRPPGSVKAAPSPAMLAPPDPADSKEEAHWNGHAPPHSGKGVEEPPSKSKGKQDATSSAMTKTPKPPTPKPIPKTVMDEKEDIQADEEEEEAAVLDVKHDPAAMEAAMEGAASSPARRDGMTIDESRNDGVLVMWYAQLPPFLKHRLPANIRQATSNTGMFPAQQTTGTDNSSPSMAESQRGRTESQGDQGRQGVMEGRRGRASLGESGNGQT